jgi:hypothetical protein
MPTLRRSALALAMALLLASRAPLPAQTEAGPALSTCLVASISPTERATLVQWVFAVLAVHPALRNITAVADTTRESLSRSVAQAIERLVTDSCRRETRAALANGNPNIFENSFGVLGQAAMTDLFSDPGVTAALAAVGKYFDQERLQKALAPDSAD